MTTQAHRRLQAALEGLTRRDYVPQVQRLMDAAREVIDEGGAAKPQVSAEVVEALERAIRAASSLDPGPSQNNLCNYITANITVRRAARDLIAAVEVAPCAPDFDAMDDDEVRAWLDERGRRDLVEGLDGWTAILWERGNLGRRIADIRAIDEPAALRGLARKVWEREQS